jgi:hypothetical protein
MFDELKYLQIHKELAEKHKQLKHNPETNVAWVGADPGEDALYVKNKAPFVMYMLPPSGRLAGDDDGIQMEVRGGFELMGHYDGAAATNYREIEEICNKAQVIGTECVLRLAAMAVGDLCQVDACHCVLAAFDPKSVVFERITGGSGWYGYRFNYRLGSGEVLGYDASAFDE